MEFAGHYLRMERRYRDHLLSHPEEVISTELSVTGRGAWTRLFDELTSALRVDLEGTDEPVSLDIALSRLFHPDRDERRKTAEAVTAALEPGLRTRAYVFNTLLQDKAIKDRLRSYPNWLAARNLSNEASDESVQALVEAVKGRYELARRWYSTKAKLLGIERLADYDRMAAVSDDDEEIGWDAGRELVTDSFASFSPEAGEIVQQFFEGRWIDAPPTPVKRGGAFSASTVPSVHPYVLLNYTDRRRDVLTLAHELGHGLHQTLARKQGVFHQDTPLTVAETASVFAEEIVFGRLLDQADEPASRLGLLAEAVEGQIATVFRQIAMNQFEDRVHTARRGEGELAVERIGELWARDPARAPRRLRRDHRRLPLLVVLRPPLHRLARLRLRLRLRPAARPLRLPPLHRARRRHGPRLPRDAERRRLDGPRGARQARRRRPHRSRLLGLGARPRRGADRSGGRGGRGRDRRAGQGRRLAVPDVSSLEPLVGRWEEVIDAPRHLDSPVEGRMTMEWLRDRNVILQRSVADDPIFPEGVSLVMSEDGKDTFTVHYFDSRGVARIYDMTFEDRALEAVARRPQAPTTSISASRAPSPTTDRRSREPGTASRTASGSRTSR